MIILIITKKTDVKMAGREEQLRSYSIGFPGVVDVKESACNEIFLPCNLPARDLESIPGSGRSPGEGNGNPLQYFCLENSMDRRAWQAPQGHKELDTIDTQIFPGPDRYSTVRIPRSKNPGVLSESRGGNLQHCLLRSPPPRKKVP